MQDLGDVRYRTLAVGQAPHERRRTIEPVRRLRLLVVDHEFLADFLGEQLIFS